MDINHYTNQLIEYFSKVEMLSLEEQEIIKDGLDIRVFEKGTHLFKAGQKTNDNYFVLKGCVRQYRLEDGEEITINFFTEEQWILSFVNNEKDLAYNLSCCEECVLVVGNDEKGNAMIKEFPKFLDISQKILQQEIINQQKGFAEFATNSPEERYQNLQKNNPELIQRVPQHQLASFLGIKPESLSRIRKRLSNK